MRARPLFLVVLAAILILAGFAGGGLSRGAIEGHLATQAENSGNHFGAAADFEAPGGGG